MSETLHADNSGSRALMLDFQGRYAVIPLRETAVYPGTATPLLLGREASLRAMEHARTQDEQLVLLLLQRDLDADELKVPEDLYDVGLVARIQSFTYLPNGYVKILVEGILPACSKDLSLKDGFWTAHIKAHPFRLPADKESQAQRKRLLERFKEYATSHNVPGEILLNLDGMPHPVDVLQVVAPYVQMSLPDVQKYLECSSLSEAVSCLLSGMGAANEMQDLRQRVEQDVRYRMQQNQREWFIHEQIRLLQEELENPELTNADHASIDKRIRSHKLPPAVEAKAREELSRLGNLHPSTPEYAVVRNYLDTLLSVPFGDYTADNLDLNRVRRELEAHHYGLEKVKERVLEHVAVLKLSPGENRSPILCLVGPPGVGKTSLAKSIAESLGRNFVRITLGGVRDEAEIRGHRRTYIGSMPGRIIQALRKAKSMNPLLLLDEMDKMSSDFRGDPASALLEVLDPEQNQEFQDHYLELGIDLSRVLFVATANVEEGIPGPLLDRMEVVRISGYHRHEKHEIVQRHLLAKVAQRNGLSIPRQLQVSPETLDVILDEYTREAGVRDLERQLDHLCRKRAWEIISKKKHRSSIQPKAVAQYLGVPPYRCNELERKALPGVVTGLAYTPVGGEILQIECVLLSGKGRLDLTGKLGDVMKESAHIALTLVRQRALQFGVDPEIFRKTDIHIHVPEGAVPKDGPSAGIALTLALLSAFTRQTVPPVVAFTGEVSLTGRLHAIGGLTEKSIAALQAGVKTIHIPLDNRRQLSELPDAVRQGLTIQTHSHIDQVISLLFQKKGK
ncbi:MAG TPA: endopeptidase La [Fibrobacteraceae bacterium]|nr:endopeptidase La [Fibrobacteraceae bacterium]